MTVVKLRYAKYKANPMNMETFKTNGGIANTFERVDRKGDYIRLTFKNLTIPALLEVTSAKEMKGIHFCEANQKGVSCNHATALAVIADCLGYDLTIINLKSSLSDVTSYVAASFDETDAENLNSHLGLLPIISEEDEEEAAETVPVSSPAPVAPTIAVTSNNGPRNPKTNWKDIQEHLTEQNIDASLIYRVYEVREKISALPILNFQSAPVKPNMPYVGEYLERAIMHILRGKHLVLIGEMGSGKDTLINTISWIFNLPKTLVSASGTDTKESIIAEPAFKNNESTYEFSDLAKSVQNGGLVNLAEANMLMGDTTSALHSLFDENRSLPTPLGAIEHHEHFLMIATLNVGANYSGTKKLNPAFKDRFAVLRLPQGEDFQAMISRKTGLLDKTALKFLENIKKAIDEFNYEGRGLDAKTYRGYEDAARFFVDFGFSIKTKNIVIEDYIINKEEDMDDYFELREAIRLAYGSFPITAEEQAYLDSKA